MSTTNRVRMAGWRASVRRIIVESPGCDEGFTADDIARNAAVNFSRFSIWSIVCEEVLDTTHPKVYFERARDELRGRGVSDETYDKLREFAWLTAGWLNYEKMLWEWCSLDGGDIFRAIEWQFQDGWISWSQRDTWIEFANQYATSAEQVDEPASMHALRVP